MAFILPHNARNPESSPMLARLLPLWERLAADESLPDPFCSSPAWQLACQETFQPWRRMYVQSSGNSLLAFSEMRDDNCHGLLLPLDSDWLFGTTLLGPEAPELLARALDELAREYYPYLLAVYLSGLGSNEAFCGLVRRFRRFFHFQLHSETVQGVVSLAGGLDGFLARKSAHHRAKIRRARRQLLAEGVIFERWQPQNAAELIPLYQRILACEEKSWKGLGHCGMTEPGPRQFYFNLLRRLPGRVRIIFARRGESDLGFIFGSTIGRVYRGQQFSYAQNFARFSPGAALQLEMIAWLCEDGFRRYDMGPCNGPKMHYKHHWIDSVRPMRAWTMILRA